MPEIPPKTLERIRAMPRVGELSRRYFGRTATRFRKSTPVRCGWHGATSSTNPEADRAFLLFVDEDGYEVMLRCTRAELGELRRQLGQLQSWMDGNNYAGMGG